MSYLFDPDNWEWVWTGNNFRFLLEGFLINLEIALIGIVFSLIFGAAAGADADLEASGWISFPAGIWVDVWRNLPLILIILYLALAVPTSWRQAYGDAIPELLPGGAPGRARPRCPARAHPLQLRRPLRDHALGDPVARPRPARGGGLARAHLHPADAVRDPAPGPAPDGPGDRLAADHAEQGHDAGQHHRDRGGLGHAGSITSSVGVLRRRPGAAPAGLPDGRAPLLRRQLRPSRGSRAGSRSASASAPARSSVASRGSRTRWPRSPTWLEGRPRSDESAEALSRSRRAPSRTSVSSRLFR